MTVLNSLETFGKSLDAIFVGDLEHLRPHLVVGRSEQASRSVRDALDDCWLDAIVESFNQTYGNTPRTAVLSIWSKWYFATALPPLICSNILLDQTPPLELEHFRIAFTPDHKIDSVAIPEGEVAPVQSRPGNRLLPIVEKHLYPFVKLYHARTGVSRRILWNNAGTLVEGLLTYLERVQIGGAARDECSDFLQLPNLPNGKRNPLFQPVAYVLLDEVPARRRRGCCLRFQLPDGKLCCACPKQEERVESSSVPDVEDVKG